jgi:hypothetical protein
LLRSCEVCGLAYEEAEPGAGCPRCASEPARPPAAQAQAAEIEPAEAAPAALQEAAGAGAPPAAPPAPGVAWERRDQVGMARGIASTVVDFLFRPGEAAARMRSGAGIGDPLLFALLLGTLALFATLVYLGGTAALAAGTATSGAGEVGGKIASLTWGGLFACAALSPLVVLVWLFAVACVLHISALMVGAGAGGFDATFRSLAYAAGSASLLAALPVCGAPLGFLWALASTAAGLASAHRVSIGRAAAAVSIPFLAALLACGGLGTLVAVLVAAAASGAGG